MRSILSSFERRSWWVPAFLLGLVFRIALMPVPGHRDDLYAFRDWTWHLINEPISRFYAINPGYEPDHLPGDVWILKIVGELTTHIVPSLSVTGPSYEYVIKGLATTFDVVIVLLLFGMGRSIGGQTRVTFQILALAYWWQPAAIFNASVWGQTDSISTAAAVGVLCLAVTRRFALACLLLTICVLIKPFFALLALPLLVGWYPAIHKNGGTTVTATLTFVRNALTAGVLSALLTAALIWPFNVRLLPGWRRWSLWERIAYAQDRYTASHGNAFNFWAVLNPTQPVPDDRDVWIGRVSRHDVGLVLLAVVVAFTCWLLLKRWSGHMTMVFATNILMLGAFLFLTRMHERYGFPLLVLSLILVGFAPRARGYAVTISILVAANIYLSFVWTPLQADTILPRFSAFDSAWLISVLGIAHVIAFAWLCCLALRSPEPPAEELDPGRQVDLRCDNARSSSPPS